MFFHVKWTLSEDETFSRMIVDSSKIRESAVMSVLVIQHWFPLGCRWQFVWTHVRQLRQTRTNANFFVNKGGNWILVLVFEKMIMFVVALELLND